MLGMATTATAECGSLCDHKWWQTATKASLRAELDAGADLIAECVTDLPVPQKMRVVEEFALPDMS